MLPAAAVHQADVHKQSGRLHALGGVAQPAAQRGSLQVQPPRETQQADEVSHIN